jgi:8-oxo-dGTP diphosphatase
MGLLDQLIAAQPCLRWTTSWGCAAFVPYDSEQDASVTHAYAVPLIEGDACIVTRRGDGQRTLPGGTCVGSQTWHATLQREILEETGCVIEHYVPFGAFRVDEGPRTTHRIVSLAEVHRARSPADPDGKRGIVEIAQVSIDEAIALFSEGQVQYGAVYSIGGALRRDGRLAR